MSRELLLWVPIITYFLVIGEALALLFGLVVAKSQSEWNTRKNHALLYIDLVLGWSTFLILLMGYAGIPILIFTTILLLSHAYRVVETTLKIEVPFCFNQPLSFINLAKFTGLAFCIILFI